MGEIEVIHMLTGKLGGMFALGVGTGAAGSWAFVQRNILKVHTTALEAAREDAEHREQQLQSKIIELERRLRALEERLLNTIQRRNSD